MERLEMRDYKWKGKCSVGNSWKHRREVSGGKMTGHKPPEKLKKEERQSEGRRSKNSGRNSWGGGVKHSFLPNLTAFLNVSCLSSFNLHWFHTGFSTDLRGSIDSISTFLANWGMCVTPQCYFHFSRCNQFTLNSR